jgi:hypothetical protein
MIYVLLIGLIVYLTYSFSSFFIYNKNKPKLEFPPSISETFYFMKPWSFVGFLMTSMACVMTLSYMYMYAVGSLELFSLTNVGALILTGVPAFANMHYKKIRILHLVCAILGFVVISAGFWVDYDMWYWTILMVIIASITYYFTRKKSPMWWVEHSLVLSMLLGYLVMILVL